MPTRIVIREPKPTDHAPPSGIHRSFRTSTDRTDDHQRPSLTRHSWWTSRRFSRSFPNFQHLSKSDISASPRLLGYTFFFVTSLVQLVSFCVFWRLQRPHEDNTRLRSDFLQQSYVYDYKLYSTLGFGIGGVTISFLIISVHFDTLCFPNFWRKVFKDGSKLERNFLWMLIACWVVGTHLCTSTFSVGALEPNVYFSSWLSLLTLTNNYDIWRVSADLPSLLKTAKKHHRRTTIYWCLLTFFSFITASSSVDLYFETQNQEDTVHFSREVTDVEWVVIIVFTWATVCICIIYLVVNARVTATMTLTQCCNVSLNWRHLEGLILLILGGLWFLCVIYYTEGGSTLVGATNVYFGIWGTFLCTVMAFGALLREMDGNEEDR